MSNALTRFVDAHYAVTQCAKRVSKARVSIGFAWQLRDPVAELVMETD